LAGWLLSAALLAFIIFGGAGQTGFRVNSAGGLQEMDPVTARTYERVLRQKGIKPKASVVQCSPEGSSHWERGKLAQTAFGRPIY
jgi:hypothetical protein